MLLSKHGVQTENRELIRFGLDKRKTAVGNEGLADDPGGFGGAEKRDDAGHVFRFSNPSGGGPFQHFLFESVEEGK